MINWKMPDGSILGIRDMQERAFKMKIEAEGITEEQAKEAFIPEVVKHWKAKTIPTKFGWDESWKDSEDVETPPKNMAELADYVMYPKIRGAMMGLMFAELAKRDAKKKKKKPKPVKVIALADDGSATSYSDKVEKHKRWEDAIPDTKKRKTSNRGSKAKRKG